MKADRLRTPLRIAIATPRFFPFSGGVENHVYQVARRFAARGSRVSIFTANPGGKLPQKDDVEGVTIRRFHAYPANSDAYYAPSLLSALYNERADYDIVHVQSYHTFIAPLAMQAAQKSNLPYVVTFHGGGHSQSWRNGIRNLQLRLLRSLLSRADKLIATAKFEIRDYGKLIDAPANKFVYIANGCDIAIREVKTNSQREYPLVISVGRLEKYKGHHRVLAAMPKLIEIQPDVRLRILGEGPYAGELKKMAQDLGVDHRVEIGGVPIERRHEMAETLVTATVVTMMSEFETQPMAALEAISLGRPTIVADTSGLSELAEQGWATAIPLNSSPVQVAEAIDRQIKNPMIAKDIRLPTWDDCANQLHDLYYEVIQAR